MALHIFNGTVVDLDTVTRIVCIPRTFAILVSSETRTCWSLKNHGGIFEQ